MIHRILLFFALYGLVNQAGYTYAQSIASEKLYPSHKQDLSSGFDFHINDTQYRQHQLETELGESFLNAANNHEKLQQQARTLHKMYTNTIQNAWNDGDYPQLENLLSQFKYKLAPTLLGCESTRELYYSAIIGAIWEAKEVNPAYSAENQIKKWKEAYPDSLAPDLVLANYYLAKASEARGDKYASETPKESMEMFQKLSIQAWKTLESIRQDKKPLDPEFYILEMSVLQNLSAPPQFIQASFHAGTQVDPDFRGLYCIWQ